MNDNSIISLNKYPRDRYNVLCPVTALQASSALQKPEVKEVVLDTRQNEQNTGPSADIYWENSAKKYAITKVGATKLAGAANISMVSSRSCRTEVCSRCIDMATATGKARSCGNCPHVYDVAYTVTLQVPEPSGGFRLIEATKEIDCVVEASHMRDGANGQQYQRFLKHRQANAESKAFMRALRFALGLKGGYTLQELSKPFIVARLIPNPDSPEIKQRLLDNLSASVGMLFGAPQVQTQQQAALPQNQAPQTIPEKVAPFPDEEPQSSAGYLPEPEYQPQEDYGQWNYGFDDTPREGEYDGVPDPPQMQAPQYQPAPTNGGRSNQQSSGREHICADCGRKITGGKSRAGKEWTPGAVAGYSRKQFGRVLCMDCQSRARGGRR